MLSTEVAKPVFRAIRIYRKVARHDLDRRLRRDVARHVRSLTEQGVHDPARLTVHALSYLRDRDRNPGSR